ncbi:MAG: hypothetical protein Ct9H300mP32_2070 [Verrucomicrobiota bacterium]|nr:MAG: hypothetical protein Ct9H300mP32_2070 [Verrucomicrobiota bacterium]
MPRRRICRFSMSSKSGDAAQRKAAIEQHGKKMRETIKALADRNYPQHIDGRSIAS